MCYRELWQSFRFLTVLIPISFLLVLQSGPALAADVGLAWDANTESDLAGYKLHYGTASGSYSNTVDVGNQTQHLLTGLTEDMTYFFAATAYDANGNESGYSGEITWTALPAGTMVIDDGAAGTSATGTWKNSGGPNPYGSGSLYSNEVGAAYTFEAAASGTHEISMWWTEYSNRDLSVPVEIYDGTTLIDTVYVDQQVNGGQWNLLGTYSFSGTARVVVSTNSNTNTTSSADAVKLVATDTSTTDSSTTTDGSTGTSTSTTTEAIVDNGGAGSSSTGTWKSSGGLNPYGDGSLYSNEPGAAYTFQAATNGTSEVSMWWTEYHNRETAVPVEIYDGSTLIDTVYVDQQVNGGQWNLLGTYSFSGDARVVVLSNSTSNTTTCADAVKFVTTATDSSTGGSTDTSTGSTDSTTDSGTGSTTGSFEAIVDNGGTGTSATGTWKTSGGPNPYGDDSLYSNEAGATYTFQAAASGTTEVSMWWTEWNNRESAVPVEIYDGSTLIDTVYVDQQVNGGQWSLLGTYSFSGDARVVIISNSTTSTTTSADAVKFVVTDTATTDSSTTTDNSTDTTTSTTTEAIIDNGGAGTSATGTWKSSGGTNPYGDSSLYSNEAGAAYTFQAAASGTTEVSMWWTEYSNRETAVPVEIYDGSTLIDTVYVDQQVNGGQWNLLGTYSFSGDARVVVLANDDTNTTTSADAVKFVSGEQTSEPVATESIIDNGGTGTSATGTWKKSGGANPYGDGSVYSNEPGATYTFQAAASGTTEVSMWWTEWNNRETAVPVEIYDGATLIDTVYVDQQANGGQWNLLGTYSFSGDARVVVLATSNSSTTTSADAVKLVSN